MLVTPSSAGVHQQHPQWKLRFHETPTLEVWSHPEATDASTLGLHAAQHQFCPLQVDRIAHSHLPATGTTLILVWSLLVWSAGPPYKWVLSTLSLDVLDLRPPKSAVTCFAHRYSHHHQNKPKKRGFGGKWGNTWRTKWF
eukprot:2096789-Amphidinium_carterae.1